MKKIICAVIAALSFSAHAGPVEDYKQALQDAMESGNSDEYRRLVEQGVPVNVPPPEKVKAAPAPAPRVSNAGRYYNDSNTRRSYSERPIYQTEADVELEDAANERRRLDLDRVTDEADYQEQSLRKAEIAARKAELQSQQNQRNYQAVQDLNRARYKASREAAGDNVRADRSPIVGVTGGGSGGGDSTTVCTNNGAFTGSRQQYYSGTEVCRTKSRSSSKPSYTGADGTLYYWSSSMKAYCYLNELGNERCI